MTNERGIENAPQRYNQARQLFRRVWREIKSTAGDGADTLRKDIVYHWWPTIKTIDPDWNVLADAYFASIAVPYHAMIMAYVYGYATALDDQQNERVRIRSQDSQDVPKWLLDLEQELKEGEGDAEIP